MALEFTQLENELLVAALEVCEGDLERRLEARALTSRYNFDQPSSDWVFEAARNLGSLGLLVPYTRDGDADDQFIQLTKSGATRAAKLRNANFLIFPKQSQRTHYALPDPVEGAIGYALPAGPPDAIEDSGAVHSASWTGRPDPIVIEGEKIEKLKTFIAQADIEFQKLGVLSNRDRAQAMAILAAIRYAADAPDPPATAIKELLQVLGDIAGIGSLLVSIVAMIAVIGK